MADQTQDGPGPAALMEAFDLVPFQCEVDRTGGVKIHTLGTRAHHVFGVHPDEALQSPDRLFSRFDSSSLRALRADERLHAEALTPWHGTYRLRHPHSGARHMMLRARARALGHGRVLWHGIAQDVTPLVARERQPRREAELFRRAVQSAQARLWDIRLEDDPATGAPHGSSDRLPGQQMTLGQWCALLHPDDAARVPQDLRAQLADGKGTCRLEVRHRAADGAWTWFAARGRIAARESGRPTRVLGLLTDISAWKGAQLELLESEARLRSLFETAPVGIVRNALDGTFLQVNTTFEAMVGYSGDDLRRLTYWDLTPTAYAAGEAAQLEALDAQKRYGPYVKEFIHADGRRIPVRLNGVLMAPIDEPPFTWSIIEDLSPAQEKPAHGEGGIAFDSVTGLPTRRLFHRRVNAALAEARTADRPLTVLTIDLDRFTPVNSAFGHAMGDAVLREMAQRLLRLIGSAEALGRVGGDEFGMLLADTADHEAIARLCTQIVKETALPMLVEGKVIRVGASIGVACYPSDARDADTLSLRSDLALALAKSAGGSTYRFFVPSLSRRAGHLMETEAALHRALAQDELELHYQPKIDLRTGTVRGLEGLIRWRRPDGTLAEPAMFIPVAEASKLIHAIGDFAVRRACRDIVALRALGQLNGRIAVNVSARQFSDESLPERIAHILADTGATGAELEVELTETTIMSDTVRATEALGRIRALGVTVAVDDFGTGHSSLAYLRRLPITGVKIDRSFLDGLRPNTSEAHIAEAIVRLGRELSLEVTAEGVETAEQEAFLRSIGCDVAQGFLYARPLAPDALRAWLSNWPGRSEGATGLTG